LANDNQLAVAIAPKHYVHSTGKVESREQFLALIVGGTLRHLDIAPMERQVVWTGR
jgi:hypothetical protein